MDSTRAERIRKLFTRREQEYTALVCRLPQNVLLFTGYQSRLGNSFCLVSLNAAREVEVRLVVPVSERDFVPDGIAIEVKTYTEETLDKIDDTLDAVREPLGEILRAAGLNGGGIVGIEGGRTPIIPAYTQVSVPGPEMQQLLHLLLLGGETRDATTLFDELAAVKTASEIKVIRRVEAIAYQGFIAARNAVSVGATSADVAAAAYAAVLRAGYATSGAQHIQPHVHVMAGPRAALAYRAFNLTSNAPIVAGEPVLVQMEVGMNGYWVELTRTFFAKTISDEWRKAHQICVAAQDAALQQIHDGASARAVDHAARQVMQQAGFGAAFKHGLGHGFGFQAINHAATPILHPVTNAILQSGMMHNMEPAVYFDGKGGYRLNDDVLVREDGCEILSSALPRDLDWVVVPA